MLNLQKELGKKQDLAIKFVNCEKQLKEANLSVRKLTYNLKKSESNRIELSKQLIEKTKESEMKSQSIKDQIYWSPSRQSKAQREIYSPNGFGAPELFNELKCLLNDIVDSFTHSEYLSRLSTTEEKSLKDVLNRLEKFQLFNTFGFISVLAKFISIKSTCDKLLSTLNPSKLVKSIVSNAQYNTVDNQSSAIGK